MRELYGIDIVSLASVISLKISECADPDELTAYIELFSLIRHNLEVVRGKCRHKSHSGRSHIHTPCSDD